MVKIMPKRNMLFPPRLKIFQHHDPPSRLEFIGGAQHLLRHGALRPAFSEIYKIYVFV